MSHVHIFQPANIFSAEKLRNEISKFNIYATGVLISNRPICYWDPVLDRLSVSALIGLVISVSEYRLIIGIGTPLIYTYKRGLVDTCYC